MRSSLALLLAVLAALPCAAWAQQVSLQGSLGSKALLVVNGGAPRALAPGESHQGVTLVSVAGGEAVVEIEGKRLNLRLGQSPVSVGAPATDSRNGSSGRIVLPVDSGGHFFTQGRINGKATQFMVDTGATRVALGAPEATRLGIDYRKGTPAHASTANGVVATWRIKLASIRIGEVELYDIDATVVPMDMPHVLLGNSFLSRFQMTRDHASMVLERRY